MLVEFLHPRATPEHVGLIPSFLVESDPRPAHEQFHERYSYGGGWFPMKGFKRNPQTNVLSYPGDPPLRPIARIKFRQELILIYEHAIVAIIQPDGTFSAARMD